MGVLTEADFNEAINQMYAKMLTDGLGLSEVAYVHELMEPTMKEVFLSITEEEIKEAEGLSHLDILVVILHEMMDLRKMVRTLLPL